MRIHVDLDQCAGHGQCHLADDTVYELDDDGFAANADIDVPTGHHDGALAGLRACPVQAISAPDGPEAR